MVIMQTSTYREKLSEAVFDACIGTVIDKVGLP